MVFEDPKIYFPFFLFLFFWYKLSGITTVLKILQLSAKKIVKFHKMTNI